MIDTNLINHRDIFDSNVLILIEEPYITNKLYNTIPSFLISDIVNYIYRGMDQDAKYYQFSKH